MSNTIAELEAANLKLQQKADALEQEVKDARLKTYKDEQVEKLKNQIVDTAVGTRNAFEKEIVEEAERRAAAQIGPALTSALAGIQVMGKISFPGEFERQGNLQKWEKQLLDICMRRKSTEMDIGAAGDGLDWVPTELSQTLIEYVQLETLLVPMLQQVILPRDIFTMPLNLADPTIQYRGEHTKSTSTTPVVDALTFNAKKLIGNVPFSYEFEESSIIPVLPWLRTALGRAMGNAEESVLVFGDDTTTAANNINKNVAGTDPQQAFNGLWYTTKNGTATWFISYGTSWPASFAAAKAAMGVCALNPRDLIYVGLPYVLNKMIGDSNFITWDKAGPWASYITGLLPNPNNAAAYGNFMGSPVVPTVHLPLTDANGVVLTTAGTKYNGLVINRNRVFWGRVKSGIRLEMFRDVEAQDNKLIVSTRVALGVPGGGTDGAICGIKNGS